MHFKKTVSSWSLIAAASALWGGVGFAQAEEMKHFDPKGKEPSKYVREIQKELRETLPFEDKRDFDEQKKGFIAAPEYQQIKGEAGNVAWDMGRYDFLLSGKDFDSVHPSLQRQAILNMNYGLYEVMPDKIYQVRGFDLSNISFIKGETGWIVFDPLTGKENAAAALAMVKEHVGDFPVKAVVYSHSHADHFGGVRGVIDEEDVKSGEVKVIAPIGFMEHAVSENVYAGNAMNRRMYFQYGVLLQASPYGHVDQSIGKNVSAGSVGLIEPSMYIKDAIEEHTIDGVKMVFQNTPGTEAPAEMNTYFPDLKAFWAAENVTGTIHNIYTLRGAEVRDALKWSKYINEALYQFGQEAEVMFASHTWPRWGNERIQEVMRGQRDMYAHLNNQVLHLVNQGVTINEIHNVYDVPKSQKENWYARFYHGSVMHNSRAVVNKYIGYWDANPSTLTPLSPGDSAPLYVEMMGGAKPILKKGQELIDEGQYRHAQEILNKLVYAEPANQEAKDLLADAWEQLGYTYESPSVRNSFLAAAYELRNGIPEGAATSTAGPDMIRAMPVEMFLDFLGIKMDATKVEDADVTINLVLPDVDETYVVEVSNAAMTNIKGYKAEEADLTITIDRKDLIPVMAGEVLLVDQIEKGVAKTEGDKEALETLRAALVEFTPGFELLPGTDKTKLEGTTPAEKPFYVRWFDMMP